jgi:hypothetical protein
MRGFGTAGSRTPWLAALTFVRGSTSDRRVIASVADYKTRLGVEPIRPVLSLGPRAP